MKGSIKLYVSAALTVAAASINAIFGYLEGLGTNPIDWLDLSQVIWGVLFLGVKDIITHRAGNPLTEVKPPPRAPAPRAVKPTKKPKGLTDLDHESGFKFSAASLRNMKGVHADLLVLCRFALARSRYDFKIVNGLRTYAEQKDLFERGKSPTMNSRHLTGHAIDYAAFDESGTYTKDYDYYRHISDTFAMVAAEEEIDIDIGIDWASVDGPHIQLSWSSYPVKEIDNDT